MAIQHRRGVYARFDPTRLVPGEWAIVLSGDPIAKDGLAAYICFASGTVKRIATYEDLNDFFLNIREDTIEYIENTATTEVKATYNTLTESLTTAEDARVAAETKRQSAENSRQSAETDRASAEASRVTAEDGRVELADDLEEKLSDGYFNGATFTPSVSDLGILSWTNDKGLPNPTSKSIKGEKGNDGVVTQLAAGMYALSIEGMDLVVTYGTGADVPDLEILDGNLVLNISDVEA